MPKKKKKNTFQNTVLYILRLIRSEYSRTVCNLKLRVLIILFLYIIYSLDIYEQDKIM